MYCPKYNCTNSPESAADKGLHLVFSVCATLGALGFAWTYFLVTDKPHSSLDDSQTIGSTGSLEDKGSIELGMAGKEQVQQ